MRPKLWRALALLGVLCSTLAPRDLRAQAAGSKAAAEALFDEATKLMEREEFVAACEKFDASQKLDPALGTILRLADCFDRIGKTASAWAMFKEAAATAGNRNQIDRERMASERAGELEKRLSRLELKVAKDATPGLELKLNGIVVPPPSWNSALPVDPGPQTIEAAAPGFKSWSGTTDVPAGPSEQAFEIPALEAAPPDPEPEIQRGPERAPVASGSTQRTIGFITGGVGVAALAASGILAYRANSLKEDSLQNCRSSDANACTPEGVALREDALDYARAATYPFVAGAALLIGGAVLIFTAPSEKKVGSRRPRLTAAANPWQASLALGVESTW